MYYLDDFPARGKRMEIEPILNIVTKIGKQQWFFGMRIHYPNNLTLIDRQKSFSSFVYVFPDFLGR